MEKCYGDTFHAFAPHARLACYPQYFFLFCTYIEARFVWGVYDKILIQRPLILSFFDENYSRLQKRTKDVMQCPPNCLNQKLQVVGFNLLESISKYLILFVVFLKIIFKSPRTVFLKYFLRFYVVRGFNTPPPPIFLMGKQKELDLFPDGPYS